MTYLISFIGAPGVGKSTLAEQLSEKEGIYFLDRDLFYNKIFGNNRDSKEPREYKVLNEPLTRAVWSLALSNVKRGVSNILESPLTGVIQGKKDSFIDDVLIDASKYNFNLSLIYCVAQEEIILSNLKKRGLHRDNFKYDNWEIFVKTFIDVPGPIYNHLVINTTNPIKQNLERIISYLDK